MSKVNPLIENQFDLQAVNTYAALMTQGNGYLGVRGSSDENYTEQTRGMFVAGIYNKFSSSDVTEIVNLPDLVGMKIEIDGEIFTLQAGEVVGYERQLDLFTGELVRKLVWKNRTGHRFQFHFQRFVSKADLHTIASKVSITALDAPASLSLKTGIDAQQSNFGKQHLIEENVRVMEKRIMHATYRTSESNLQVALATFCKVTQDSVPVFVAKNRQLTATYSQHLEVNQPFVLEKISAIYTSNDVGVDEADAASIQSVERNGSAGYDQLQNQSAAKWKMFWDNKRVKISSSYEMDQLALDFSIYHMEIMTPAHDERLSIGAKGLTGEGYKGHVFWDTELFIAPFHLHTVPEVAKKLLTYRYLHIEEAKYKAAQNGYEGTLFPWESALTGHEETPEYAAINISTGKRQKVASAVAEHHIVADIAYAVVQYYYSTLDEAFMQNEGIALLKETALFWISRAANEGGRLSIKDVIGPDEYTEHIDNNAYTNYMAAFNVQQAVFFLDKYDQQDLTFDQRAKVFLQNLYMPRPNEEGILPQDDTFLTKPDIDLTKYKMKQGNQAILLDYSRAEVNEMQILKQADVVMLLYLMPNLFPAEIVKKNLQYYEEHTIHDSSLSKAIHAIVAARCGKHDNAYQFFQEACLIDLGSNPKSSDEGIHAASLGANWLTAIFGFANITMEQNQLSISPKLPKNWSELTFTFEWQGSTLVFTISQTELRVARKAGPEVSLRVNEKIYNFLNQIQVTL